MSHDSSATLSIASSRSSLTAPVFEAVADAVERLRFGVVQLTIHEGKVVQLDVTDRLRFR